VKEDCVVNQLEKAILTFFNASFSNVKIQNVSPGSFFKTNLKHSKTLSWSTNFDGRNCYYINPFDYKVDAKEKHLSYKLKHGRLIATFIKEATQTEQRAPACASKKNKTLHSEALCATHRLLSHLFNLRVTYAEIFRRKKPRQIFFIFGLAKIMVLLVMVTLF